MFTLVSSLMLTAFMSFTVPLLLVGTLLSSFLVASYIPGLTLLGHSGARDILNFLTIFGNGFPVQGIFVIGITCGIVGTLLDLFNFCRYEYRRSN